MTNTALWDQLKAVPKDAQKPFKRAGGFSGTAIKPMWTYHRMTEVFGPCGTGWGIEKPEFQVIPAGDELLVYCTVAVWYNKPSDTVSAPPEPPAYLVGVGGDKVFGKSKYGLASDDEAFKKAFTDAVTNALKTLGAGADVHMGVHDSKYTAPEPEPSGPPPDPEAYTSDALAHIKTLPDKAAASAWWEAEAAARRTNNLTQGHVDVLKNAMTERFSKKEAA